MAAAGICIGLVSGCASTHDGHPVRAEATAGVSAKPDITRMSESLVVGRDSFPAEPGANWRAPYMAEHSSSGDPAQCAPLLLDVEHSDDSLARASLMGENRNPIFRIDLVLPTEALPDWTSLVEKCRSFGRGDNRFMVKPASIDALPSSVAAFRMTISDVDDRESLVVVGNYRGLILYLQVHRKPALTADDTSAAARLFNDQVAKLEAATA
ncbi:MAG: hypothetical protein ACM4D3_10060 [Candidatus Sericytochromatia bacterium]